MVVGDAHNIAFLVPVSGPRAIGDQEGATAAIVGCHSRDAVAARRTQDTLRRGAAGTRNHTLANTRTLAFHDCKRGVACCRRC